MRRHRRKMILVHTLLISSAISLVLPIVWLFILSFRPNPVISTGVGSIISPQFVLDNYITLFRNYSITRAIFNSIIGAVVPACLSVLVALLAGYAMVRFRFRGRRFFYSLPLFAQIVPTILLLIPFYAFMLVLGILNTYFAVILAHTSLVLPFAVWVMTGYLMGVPHEIEEAAMIDGCSRLGAIFRVVIPIAMPGISATGAVAFLTAWAEFLFPFVLTSSQNMRLLSVVVYLFMSGEQGGTSWGVLFAAATVFMIPSLLLFLILQRSFSRGLSLGATAG